MADRSYCCCCGVTHDHQTDGWSKYACEAWISLKAPFTQKRTSMYMAMDMAMDCVDASMSVLHNGIRRLSASPDQGLHSDRNWQ